MGTKVQCESCFPGYFSMRDLNEDSNSCSWPLYYGDRTFPNGQYYNGFLPRAVADVFPGYDRDIVKQTMLEHEAIFKNQLCELHRLYKIQRDLMDEVKRKELYKNRMPVETSLSSSPLASQITSEDARKWQIPSLPLGNSVYAGPSTSGMEDMHSPLSSMKGSSLQASPLLSRNGGTSKDVEILDSRPSKVRRKMIDLHLPADEYIDTEEGEQIKDENVCGISSLLPNRCHKVAPESGTNLLIGTVGKSICQDEPLQSESCLKSKNNLADLNEPIEIEDNSLSANDLLGCTPSHYGIQGHELATKPKSQFHGFPKEILLNSHNGSNNGTVNDLHLQNNNGNGKLWFPHTLNSGNSKNSFNSVSQGLQPEKLSSSSQPVQVLLNKTNQPATFFLADPSKVDQLRERAIRGSELSGINQEVSTNNHAGLVVASHTASYVIDPSSDLSNSWSRSISPWEKLNGTLNQKSISGQMHPYFNSSATLSRSSQSSTQSHGIFGERWNYNSGSTSNLRVGSDIAEQNGFYHGSSSAPKELLIRFPSGNCDYLNGNSASIVPPENFNHGSAKFYRSSSCLESKPAKEVNLNIAFSNSSPSKMASKQNVEVIDLERNQEDLPVTLPWLRSKPSRKTAATSVGVDLNSGGFIDLQSSPNQVSDTTEAGKIPVPASMEEMKSASCSNVVEASRIETSNSSSCRKILGFPIFEKPHIVKIEYSSLTSPNGSLTQPSEVENNRKCRVLDINLPCDPTANDQEIAPKAVLIENESDSQVAIVRHEIDLNSCVTEDEASLTPSMPVSDKIVPSSDVKKILGIDLEVPAVPETEEDIFPGVEFQENAQEPPKLLSSQLEAESRSDEFVKTAAEAIVAISSSVFQNLKDDRPEASMTDPLHWFVEVVSSFAEDLENKNGVSGAKNGQDNEGSSSEDYFESMTLKLEETKEEDYMPKPLVPENLKIEEAVTSLLPTRTRKGHARRGRQRRDFQRDILPGLASLSRHEVTEDLQTFGGLMRATGHFWQSGVTRRNSTRGGCGRGRRRGVVSSTPAAAVAIPPPCAPLIEQLNNVEAGLEDRSLTGWGKTTRRPRRQRCPPGNTPVAPLT